MLHEENFMQKNPNRIKSFFTIFLFLFFSCTQPNLVASVSPENDSPQVTQEEQLPPEIQEQIKKMRNDFLEEKLKPTLKLYE